MKLVMKRRPQSRGKSQQGKRLRLRMCKTHARRMPKDLSGSKILSPWVQWGRRIRPSDDRQSLMEGWRAGGGRGGGVGDGSDCRLHRRSVKVRQGGYLLRWADSTNQYHTAQADERARESGERKGEKEFREDPRAAWQGRTTQCSTLLQAGEAAPKWQLMPHTTQFPCWLRAAIGESLAQVPGLAVGRGREVPYLASAPNSGISPVDTCRWAGVHWARGSRCPCPGSLCELAMYSTVV